MKPPRLRSIAGLDRVLVPGTRLRLVFHDEEVAPTSPRPPKILPARGTIHTITNVETGKYVAISPGLGRTDGAYLWSLEGPLVLEGPAAISVLSTDGQVYLTWEILDVPEGTR